MEQHRVESSPTLLVVAMSRTFAVAPHRLALKN